jgi:hypothetical protein
MSNERVFHLRGAHRIVAKAGAKNSGIIYSGFEKWQRNICICVEINGRTLRGLFWNAQSCVRSGICGSYRSKFPAGAIPESGRAVFPCRGMLMIGRRVPWERAAYADLSQRLPS